MAALLVLLPLAFAALAFAIPSNRWRPWCLPLAGVAHFALVCRLLANGPSRHPGGWLALDPPGKLVLTLVSLLFCLCSFYSVGYLRHRLERTNRVFCACVLGFLATTTLVATAHHLGLLWVGLEATTLATAPLIYFNRNRRSIEATWKYLMVCSVGIALALLGSFFLAYASLKQGLPPSLFFDDLLRDAPRLSPPWLHAAFVLLLVGYGTKMGLAPMHTWKPDAYGEAPGVVGALLAGGLTSCAFLAVLRVYQLCNAAEAVGGALYARNMLLALGLLSMAAAAVLAMRQKDFKRMLAYSSVEHMGLLAVGIGIGGPATFGALFHMVNNALAKGVLFLSAGNIHRAYGSKRTGEVSGAARRLPLSGWMFLLGFLAVTGSPPFAPFQSIFAILNGAFAGGRSVTGALILALLFLVFLGMGATVLAVVQGRPPQRSASPSYRDGVLTGLPLLVLFGLVLLLGFYLPPPLADLIRDAAQFVQARP